MNVNGQNRDASGAVGVLRWAGGVITADGLRESLNGERELVVTPRTVITPLAADHLKANGVRVVRQEAVPRASQAVARRGRWMTLEVAVPVLPLVSLALALAALVASLVAPCGAGRATLDSGPTWEEMEEAHRRAHPPEPSLKRAPRSAPRRGRRGR